MSVAVARVLPFSLKQAPIKIVADRPFNMWLDIFGYQFGYRMVE